MRDYDKIIQFIKLNRIFLSVQKALNLGPNLKVYDVEMEFHFLYD